MIVVIDYGMGNVGSMRNMFKKIGAPVTVSADPAVIRSAAKLVLPGVGAFDEGMSNLARLELAPVLEQKVRQEGTPILGVCLGMQLFTRSSEEGVAPGLGWIAADTVRFKVPAADRTLKVPHMGWNSVQALRAGSLFDGLDEDAGFYFVHSYHLACDRPDDVVATTCHGYEFPAAVQSGNILGVQFHPEKSHTYGMQILRRFAGIA